MTEIINPIDTIEIDTIPKQIIFTMLKERRNLYFDKINIAKHIINLLDSNQIDGDGICVLIESSKLNYILSKLKINTHLLRENIEAYVYILKIGDLWKRENHVKEFIFYVDFLDSSEFISFEIDIKEATLFCKEFVALIEYISDGDIKKVLTKQECVVCLDKKRFVTLYPCKHNCCCYECFHKILDSTKTCPLCRQFLTKQINFIY